ncbi:hypothetical protein HPB52_005061 [Rhipicephalus sanguineus]|uniref:Uncharacterized protein n=1 Tax=Rhipicephalus sanguineus TaxID=34632 RepID=A0A9D4T8L1_RHISA|nr:hypothetical protein HPB52_005061 [Rhipicephalus sanguineus]
MRLSKVAEDGDGFIADEVVVHDNPKPKLAELDAVDIMRQLRNVLQENGPSEEDDLRKALSTSQAQMIVNTYGTITAFLDHCPGFEIIYEDLYTFVYYQSTDDEDDVLDGATTESSKDCSLQDAMAGDGVHQRTSAISSDISLYVSAGGGGDNERAMCRMRNAWSQVPSLRLHHSRALQTMQQTCDAEVQTQGCEPARIAELKSGLQKRDVQITGLKQRLNDIRESQAIEAQQIRDKIRRLKTPSPPPLPVPRRSAAKVNNMRTSKKERQHTRTHEIEAQASSRAPKPRPPFYPPHPRPQPKAKEKPHSLPFRQTPSPMSLIRRQSPPRHRQKFQEKTRAFPNDPRPRPVPTRRRRYPPPPPKAEKPLALANRTVPQPVSPWRRSTAPRSKAEERPCSLPTRQNPLPKPQPRRRSPTQSRQKTQEKIRAFPIGSRSQPAPTLRQRPPPLPPKAEVKSRAQPIGSVSRSMSPLHRGSLASRAKAEEKQRALPISPKPRLVPPIDKNLTKSAERQPVPECHGRRGHHKQVSAAGRDVESTKPGQEASPAKSKAEEQMSRLVQMVKMKKPEYTVREIRVHMDQLRRSQGGFSRKTFNAIVDMVISHLESEENR